jgi:hypothetical protein
VRAARTTVAKELVGDLKAVSLFMSVRGKENSTRRILPGDISGGLSGSSHQSPPTLKFDHTSTKFGRFHSLNRLGNSD